MGIGEAHAAKIGHGVALHPHDVIQNPVAQVLQDAAHPIDVVIRPDNPKRARGFEHPPALTKPLAREVIIRREAFKLIPVLGDPVHLADVRAPKVAL